MGGVTPQKGFFIMKTINTKFVRTTAVILAVITVFSMIFALPVSAVSDEVTIIFDYCYGAMRS